MLKNMRRWFTRIAVLSVLIGATFAQSIGIAPIKSGGKNNKVSISMKVSDGGWSIQIMQVHQTKSELLVVSQLKRHPGSAPQVISTVRDSVEINAPALPVKHLVLGRTWGWDNKEAYTFLKDDKQLAKHLAGSKQVFKRKVQVKKEDKIAKQRYIVVYRKEIFTNGKTKKGETLQQISERHCREFNGSSPSLLKIINAFVSDFTSKDIAKIKNLNEVKYVEKDR